MNLSPYQVTMGSGRHTVSKHQLVCIWRRGQNQSISTSRDRGIDKWWLIWIEDRTLDESPWVLIFISGYDPSCRAGSSPVLIETTVDLTLPQKLFCGSSQSIKYQCAQPWDASGQVYANLEVPWSRVFWILTYCFLIWENISSIFFKKRFDSYLNKIEGKWHDQFII